MVSGCVIVIVLNIYDMFVLNLLDQVVFEQVCVLGGYVSLEGGSDIEIDSVFVLVVLVFVVCSNGCCKDLYQLYVVVVLGMFFCDELSIGLNILVCKWVGIGLLVDCWLEDGSSILCGFGLIGESGCDECFLQFV